jgi:sugar phosphate isomerase/epimerase
MEKRVALALYTVRDAFAADSQSTLKAVRDIGYGAVEFAGLGRWKEEDVRAQLDDLGLRGLSAHVPLQRLRDDLPGVIREAKTLGLQYIAFPWLPPEQRTVGFYRALVPILKATGEACAAEGLTFCYHNHDFELEPVFGGMNALEFFAQEVSAQHLAFELDVYWAAFAGLDPIQVLERFAGRTPLVHFKDMTNDGSRTFAEVGSGSLDFAEILETCTRGGAQWGIVEQDQCQRPPLESAAMSFNHLRTLGFGA